MKLPKDVAFDLNKNIWNLFIETLNKFSTFKVDVKKFSEIATEISEHMRKKGMDEIRRNCLVNGWYELTYEQIRKGVHEQEESIRLTELEREQYFQNIRETK